MRNLILLNEKELDGYKGPSTLAVHPFNESFGIVSKDGGVRVGSANEPDRVLESDLNGDPVGAFWMCGSNLTVVESNGTIRSFVDEEWIKSEIPDEISTCELSPDESRLALVTPNGLVRILDAYGEWDPLGEADLNAEAQTDFLNVGWGKKSTQFHGSEGKAAALEESPSARTLTEFDSKRSLLSWREDSGMFVVSFIRENERKLRIFDHEGAFISESESLQGLEDSLSWRPSTPALIAVPQRLPNKLVIAFIEKNGLKHGDFELPIAKETWTRILNLKWNNKGTVLAIHTFEEASNGVKNYRLILATSGNYHWYIKYARTYTENFSLNWDLNSSYKLYINGVNGRINVLEFTRDNISSGCRQSEDLCYLASIDGSVLKMTPMRQVIIPPPISAYEIRFSKSVFINQVCFGPDTQEACNSICVVLSNNDLYVFELQTSSNRVVDSEVELKITGAGGRDFKVKCTSHTFYKKVNIQELNNYIGLRQLTWVTPSVIIFSASLGETSGVVVLKDFKFLTFIPTGKSVYRIAAYNDVAAVQLLDGTLLKYRDEKVIPWKSISDEEINFPQCCTKLSVIDDFNVLGLTKSNRLYLNKNEISAGINSFFLHSHFLLATTLKHVLKSIPINDLIETHEKKWLSESFRCIERGSRLVIAQPHDSFVLFQMPRGNLETIHPRPLAINVVKNHLSAKNYLAANQILRKHRINLNLIVDHDPKLFLENVKKFIEDVNDDNKICLFIADLSDEDVTKTMYKAMYVGHHNFNYGGESKVDSVCKEILKVLETNEEKHITPIISCLIRQSTSKIDFALRRINDFREKGKEDLADKGINFLILSVDVDKLFNIALGTYNFDLVLFVAEKSQKDPKEYVPFLNGLKSLPLEYRKFVIDKRLKNYDIALTNATLIEAPISSDIISEVVTLVESERLYSKAIKTFMNVKELLVPTCESYGNYLVQKRFYEEAGLIFELGGSHLKALEAWEKSYNIGYTLALAKTVLGEDVRAYNDFCKRVIVKCKDEQRYKEAAELYINYLQNYEEAVVCLLNGSFWEEAYALIAKNGRSDLKITNLIPAVREQSEQILSNVKSRRKDFALKTQRLKEVLEIKAKVQSGDVEDLDINVNDDDIFSEFSHVQSVASRAKSHSASLHTRMTHRSKSSKNRRKHEKKKYSTREGSVYEDIGLIAELHLLINMIYKSCDEVRSFLLISIKVNEFETAREIQRELKASLKEVNESIGKIWTVEIVEDNTYGPNATTEEIVKANIPLNAYRPPFNILESHYRYPPLKPPSLSSWEIQLLND